MDYFDQRILYALKDGKHHKFSAQQDQVGFSHNTLQQHLTGLIEKGIVLKEKDPARGFGRPRYFYCTRSTAAKQVAVELDNPDV